MRSWQEMLFSWAKSFSFPLSGANLLSNGTATTQVATLRLFHFADKATEITGLTLRFLPSSLPPIFSFLVCQCSSNFSVHENPLKGSSQTDCWAPSWVHLQVWGRSLEYAFFFFFFRSPATIAGPRTTLSRTTALCLVWQKGSSSVFLALPLTSCDLEQDIISKEYPSFKIQWALFTFHSLLFCLSILALSPDFLSIKTPLSGSFGDNGEEN